MTRLGGLGPSLQVARHTVAEAVSRRLVLAGVVLSVAFVVLFTVGFRFLYGKVTADPVSGVDEGAIAAAILTVLGLYAVHFLAGALSLFLSVGAVSAEIDAGTLHAVLARPLRRRDWLLGRWLAYAGISVLYVTAMASALLLVSRVIADYEAVAPVPAIALMCLEAVLLLTLSLLGSTRMSTLANGVVVFGLFGLAWLAGIIEFVGSTVRNEAMANLGVVVSLVIPSDAVWRGASYYAQSGAVLAANSITGGLPFASATPPAWPMLAWALGYVGVCLLLAMLSFHGRDL